MTPGDNDVLCKVEADAPMGRLMRAHWLPVCMSSEVTAADAAPVRARLLGENLVVFRDTGGRLGVLDERCPHRGASLAFGRNEEAGLRCLYHGWKFDVGGNVLEMPCEPDSARMRRNLRHRAYPVHEGGGFVWIWMGQREQARPFESPAWAPTPDTRISIVKIHTACNWAQVLEGAIDSAHSSSLHATNMPPAATVASSTATETAWLRPSLDKAPRLHVQQTNWGFHYAALRTPIHDAETHHYVRTTVFIAPFTVLIPPTDQYKLAQMLVPMDDGNCMFYWIAWHETAGIGEEAWRRFCAAEVGIDLDASFRKLRNASNHYLQDRDAMARGDFTGIKGVPAQDMAMWESMGAIADRTCDHLGSSDLAIVQFRRQMVAAAKAVAAGGPAIGTQAPHVAHVSLRSFEGLVPKTVDWRTLGEGDVEPGALARRV
jgi:phthalate 4,5-dioxygenase